MDGLGISSDETALDRTLRAGELVSHAADKSPRTSQETQILTELSDAEQAFGPDSVELLPALGRLAALRIGRGEAERAAPLVLRALDINDLHPQDRPELVLVLTDLTRLCIKQSAHTLAEPLLLRLLEMKRGKGEDHPEVATVLASLATVRQALGHHESAEQLWRRVLEIREKTLAPNHFAVATAIERLGDSCAARGKTSEALQLFKRSLAMRELTLGSGHASLRVLRERIADLELQASEELFEGADSLEVSATTISTPLFSSTPSATTRQKPFERAIAAPPITRTHSKKAAAPAPLTPLAAAVAADSLPPVATAIAPTPAITALTAVPIPAPMTVPSAGGAAAYRDLVMSIEKDLDDENPADTRPQALAAVTAAIATLVSNRRKVVALAGGAGVILLLSLAADSRAGTERDVVQGNDGGTPASHTAANSPASAAAATIPVPIATVAKQPAESVRSAIASFISSGRAKSSEGKSEKKSEERQSPPKVVIPKVSQSVLARADSIARSINTPTADVTEVAAAPTISVGHTRLWNADQEGSSVPTRARLIGSVPTPRLPDQLADVQGLVKVWVRVDTSGRPVMSTFSIENSPNPLLTAAIKHVITDLRFEPARSGGSNSRAMVDSVQVGFNFSRSR